MQCTPLPSTSCEQLLIDSRSGDGFTLIQDCLFISKSRALLLSTATALILDLSSFLGYPASPTYFNWFITMYIYFNTQLLISSATEYCNSMHKFCCCRRLGKEPVECLMLIRINRWFLYIASVCLQSLVTGSVMLQCVIAMLGSSHTSTWCKECS